MLKHPLDYNTRKSLCVHLGETTGRAIADLVFELASRVEALERGKVDVTPIIPQSRARAEAAIGHPERAAATSDWMS